MNEIHDDDQIQLPLIGKLVEIIDLRAIAVDRG
jgi:hypothetical protein